METNATIVRYVLAEGALKPLITIQFDHFPRSVLADITRHRSCSFSVHSSRARGTGGMADEAESDPFIPSPWIKNEPGMGGAKPLDKTKAAILSENRRMLAQTVARCARFEAEMGAKKEQVNRILEPFTTIGLVFSTTELGAVLKLRCAPDVDQALMPIMQRLAVAVCEPEPTIIRYADWSMPYLLEHELNEPLEHRLIHSVARCARATTGKLGEVSTLKDDAKLVLRLLGNEVKPQKYWYAEWVFTQNRFCMREASTDENIHASPFEHQIMVDRCPADLYGNFCRPYRQLRHNSPMLGKVEREARRLTGA